MDSGAGSGNNGGRDRMPPGERTGRGRAGRGESIGEDSLIGKGPPPDFKKSAAPMFGQNPGTGPSLYTPGGSGPVAADQLGGPASDELAPRFRPWSEPAPPPAQGGPMRCHFLRSVGADGRLGEAQKTAVPTHRCAAFGDPLPLSLRQQELVCLQRVHVSCPRYVRGTLLANESQPAPAEDEQQRQIPILTILGVGLVVVALYVLVSGVFGLPPFGGAGAGATSNVAVNTPQRSATDSPTIKPTASPTIKPTASPIASASPKASASPSPSATPTASPTPVASPTWPPGATASRMDLVVPCPGQSDCYIYTVRGAGPPPAGNGSPVADTAPAIAKFFGVNVNTIYSMNPGSSNGITPGQQLKIPPPTR